MRMGSCFVGQNAGGAGDSEVRQFTGVYCSCGGNVQQKSIVNDESYTHHIPYASVMLWPSLLSAHAGHEEMPARPNGVCLRVYIQECVLPSRYSQRLHRACCNSASETMLSSSSLYRGLQTSSILADMRLGTQCWNSALHPKQ